MEGLHPVKQSNRLGYRGYVTYRQAEFVIVLFYSHNPLFPVHEIHYREKKRTAVEL
jgi:hypothetical protein